MIFIHGRYVVLQNDYSGKTTGKIVASNSWLMGLKHIVIIIRSTYKMMILDDLVSMSD